MVQRWAVATGNWSNTATWNGGTVPGPTDDVYANGFTVTIDQDVTVLSLRIIAGTTAVAGGNFTCSSTRTITVNEASVGAFTTGTSSGVLTLTGGACTLNVASPIVGDSSSTGAEPIAIVVTGGTHVLNADFTGGAAGNGHAATISGASVVAVNGDLIGNGGSGVYLSSGTPQVTIIGAVSNVGSGIALRADAGVARVDGTVTIGGFAPYSAGGSGAIMFSRDSTFIVPSDDHWPATTGDPITLTSGGGGGEPVAPKRYLNVGGVATAIQ